MPRCRKCKGMRSRHRHNRRSYHSRGDPGRVPVTISNRGYGILWDDPAVTEVNVNAGREEPRISERAG